MLSEQSPTWGLMTSQAKHIYNKLTVPSPITKSRKLAVTLVLESEPGPGPPGSPRTSGNWRHTGRAAGRTGEPSTGAGGGRWPAPAEAQSHKTGFNGEGPG